MGSASHHATVGAGEKNKDVFDERRRLYVLSEVGILFRKMLEMQLLDHLYIKNISLDGRVDLLFSFFHRVLFFNMIFKELYNLHLQV